MQLAKITIYPVKSCAGINLTTVEIDRFGPKGDRRWMVVNETGGFLTQREIAQMSQVAVALVPSGLRLECNGSVSNVTEPDADAPIRQVQVWDDHVPARDAGGDTAEWLSRHLGSACRLVFMPDDTVRRVDGAYASEGETVGFADAFPLLLISQASLDELNSRLPVPVPMNRFRPNLVVSGCEAFAEDEWRRIRIDKMEFDVAKACSRCVIPSIVQETGRRDPHINRALAGFRRINGQIYFGQNLLYQQPGMLKVGDSLEVLA
jgi:uncharacterized protein YcbX